MTNSEAGTSSSNTFKGEYQVFLSFRGPDTRQGFTSSLYHALVEAGIRVFMDDEELRVGEGISGSLLQAINNSKLYIPIFSKNYASSHWCLRELAKMVEKTSNFEEDGEKVILPIFYDVKPDVLKLQTEVYSKAISNLENQEEGQQKKFKSEEVEKWRQALKKVKKITGWELEKYRGYGDLIESVVNEVVIRLRTRERPVTKDLVGMENRIATIDNLLDIDSDDVRLIGIYGMGGIGKTTLANIIFNKLYSRFGKNCSFLEEVRERAKSKEGLVNLQKELLSDISYSSAVREFNNIDVGINIIGDTICNKVLIVLDDVDEGKQIEKLIGVELLYPGTRIIVTTRDRRVLDIRGFKYKFKDYEMVGLNDKDALKLFCKHAFNDNFPPKNYYTLSKSIVSTASGLPLALHAIGGSLFHEERDIWKEWLAKLKKTLHDDVFGKLKISFDALDTSQKLIFLDIACFFIGESMTNPMYMWDGCEFFPKTNIKGLIRRCMIKISGNGRFQMHDQFRDLGRAIAKEECSRLWDREEIIGELRSIECCQQGKPSVQALRLSSQDCMTVTSEKIKRFPHLRFLWLHDVICQGDFTDCLFELRWIRLGYPYGYPDHDRMNQCLEATKLLHLENVVVVNLSGLDITEDVLDSLIQGARKLKVLTITFNRSINGTPTFPKYSVLKKLTMSHFLSLREIDCSIGKLTGLTDLSFETCTALEELPKEIGLLQELRHLSLKGCDLIELPDSVSQLGRLTTLDVSRTRVTRLPDSIGRLSRLLSVDASLTPIEKLPGSMSKLLRLQRLRLNHCNQIQELPELPRSLTILCLTSTSLLAVPDLSDLANLVELALSDGSEAMARPDPIQTCDLQWIGSLSQLQKLRFCFSNVCAPTRELGSLSTLEELIIHGLGVPSFELLPSKLIAVELYDTRGKRVRHPPSEKKTAIVSSSSREPEEEKALRQLKLEFLEFYGFSVDLQEETECNELQAPEFIDHWKGDFLFPSSLNRLQKFTLCGVPEVQDIRFVSTLESLWVLSVRGCSSLKSLGGLSNLKHLLELTLDECPNLQVVEGIDELKFLRELEIDSCRSMGRIFDASSSKIPNKCQTRIRRSGQLPDGGDTCFTWETYKDAILNGTKLASSSESETETEEQTRESEFLLRSQETEEQSRESETESLSCCGLGFFLSCCSRNSPLLDPRRA